jgi:hypothetical protein
MSMELPGFHMSWIRLYAVPHLKAHRLCVGHDKSVNNVIVQCCAVSNAECRTHEECQCAAQSLPQTGQGQLRFWMRRWATPCALTAWLRSHLLEHSKATNGLSPLYNTSRTYLGSLCRTLPKLREGAGARPHSSRMQQRVR